LETLDRRFLRKHINVRFIVKGEQLSGEIWFKSEDVSLGGVYLMSDFLLDKGEKLELSLEIPESGETLELQAEIAWVNLGMEDSQKDRYPGMGIKFMNPDQNAIEVLANILK